MAFSIGGDQGFAGRAPERAVPSPRGAEAGEAGGLLTSRPPSNPISYGGEDWLTLSLYVLHHDFEKMRNLLDRHRQAAEDGRKGEDEITLAGQTFLVLPAGGRVGSKGPKRKRAYFRWQLQNATGFILQFMQQPFWSSAMPNAKLEATSVVMMRLGIDGVVGQAFDAIRALGSTVERNKVSRVEVCCDLPGRKVEPLKAAYDADHVVCRATSSDEHGDEVGIVESDYHIYRLRRETTSFNVGRGAVRLRVYEKVRECKHELEKLQLLVERRWGVFPFQAIRAEYQVRRKKLKQLGVDSLSDWMEKRAAIVRYLAHDWFRLTDGPVDRKHPDRTAILPEWCEVQQGFASWAGNGPFPELTAIPTQPMPPDHYTKTIVGSLVSLFARTGVDVDSNETFWNEGMYRILDEIERRDMAAEVRRRALELGVMQLKEQPPSES
jgi:hypothetical protein